MLRLALIVGVVSALASASGTWYFRGVLCDRARLTFQQELSAKTTQALTRERDKAQAQAQADNATLLQWKQERDAAVTAASRLRETLKQARQNAEKANEAYATCNALPLPAAVADGLRHALHGVMPSSDTGATP